MKTIGTKEETMSQNEINEGYRRIGELRVALEAAEAAYRLKYGPYKTYHLADCQRAWGNYDARCPRCLELKGGAPARKGWSR